MKTKLLFLIGSYETGGKERQLTEIIKNLPAEKYAIYLFMKEFAGSYFSEIENRLAGYCNLNRKKFDAASFFQLGSYLSEVKPDVVVSFATLPAHMALLQKRMLCRKFRLVNISIRDAPAKLDLSQKMEAILLNCYRNVVANSQAGLKAYHQYTKPGRHVLYNGYDLRRNVNQSKYEARDNLGFPRSSFIVVMVAVLQDRKDHMTFIKAAYECIKRESRICFYLVGDGYNRGKLEAYVQSLGIGESLQFLGERRDVEVILCATDLSVLTSAPFHGEGIPNSVLESMACGTPVIATDSGGTREIVDETNGIMINYGDDKTLAEKILFLKSHPLVLGEFSENAKRKVLKKFSIHAMISRFIEIIETSQ